MLQYQQEANDRINERRLAISRMIFSDEAAQGTHSVSSGISGVQAATDQTRETVSNVVRSSQVLTQQESSLIDLRGNIVGFLTELRKVG